MKKKFNWDRTEDKDIITFRCMLYEPVRNVLKLYSKKYLKKIYFQKFWEFDKRNKEFWKIVLEISDDDIKKFKQNSKASFRETCKIWNY